MKNKIFKVMISVFLVMFLTGCRKSYLNCHKIIIDDDLMKANKTIRLVYESGELKNSNLYFDYKIYDQNTIDNLRKELNLDCEGNEGIKGVTCDVSNIEGGLHYQLTIDLESLPVEYEYKFSEIIDFENYTDAKNELMKEYTCD